MHKVCSKTLKRWILFVRSTICLAGLKVTGKFMLEVVAWMQIAESGVYTNFQFNFFRKM